MVEVEPGLMEVVCHRVSRTLPLEGTDQPCEARLHVGVEPERLANFTRCGAAAVRDDVGAHGCAELAVALVHILDGSLPVTAGRQI